MPEKKLRILYVEDDRSLAASLKLGLGTLVMGIRDEKRIRELLSIPSQETIVSVIAVGYPDIDPLQPKRKSVTDITTYH